MRRCACLVLLLTALAGSAQEDSWVGKTIITKSNDIKITRTDANDKAYVTALTDNIAYRVLGDKGGRIQVMTSQGIVGWLDKTDAVLSEKAVDHFTQILKNNPRNADAYQKRAYALEVNGKLDAALKDINEAIRVQPADMAGWNSRGIILAAKKEYVLAIRDFGLAIRLDPILPYAYCNRGEVWIKLDKLDKALNDFNMAVMLDPKLASGFVHRGHVWFLKKYYDKALTDFDQAEKLQPTNGHVYKQRARLLATSPEAKQRDGKRAVEQAKKALELERDPDGDFYEVLAAAYAEAGDFKEAIRWQEQALQEPRWKDDEAAQARLELYRKKTPYRQE